MSDKNKKKKRIEELPLVEAQNIMLEVVKLINDKAAEHGLVGIPCILTVFGPEIPIVCSTMPPHDVRRGLALLRTLQMYKSEERDPNDVSRKIPPRGPVNTDFSDN